MASLKISIFKDSFPHQHNYCVGSWFGLVEGKIVHINADYNSESNTTLIYSMTVRIPRLFKPGLRLKFDQFVVENNFTPCIGIVGIGTKVSFLDQDVYLEYPVSLSIGENVFDMTLLGVEG